MDREIIHISECEKCGAIFTLPDIPKSCSDCQGKKINFLGWKYEPEVLKKALEKFKEKNLLNLVWGELSKTHIGDDNLKLTLFLTMVSGLLKNQKRRMSQAITGNSSEGKDNCIRTCLEHIPKDSFIFLTSATESTIQDDIKDKRIIALSEVNANRDFGANKLLIEVIKQKTEGGTSAIKKDIRTGMKTARFEEGEQASVIYGTTESRMDEEMSTRFIRSGIKTDSVRIKKVNEDTLDRFSEEDKLLKDNSKKDSWLRKGLTSFFGGKEQFEILLPYVKYLKEKINGKDIFDHNDPRSQRDLKRILSLTCAMTYLFQEQREKKTYQGMPILISEPQDFLNTLIIAGEFFNQSYTGLDPRLTEVLKLVESGGGWVARDYLEKKIMVSRNTIKEYCKTLDDAGLIEDMRGRELNDKEGLKVYDGNKIYYKRCQKGIKKRLIRCEENELKSFLEEKTGKVIDTFYFIHNSDDKKNTQRCQKQGVKRSVGDEKSTSKQEIDTFSLTPFTKEDLLKAGYSEEQALEVLE